mmetsp:Transcript_41475/g.120094  ORF Transcript_41475/g.120094 Transcript_41475/m.120094 type:complete len:253 (-) Transcript_41475:17-775(-)
MKMHIEGLQAPQHREADTAGGHRAHMHALDIVGTHDAVRDVPSAEDHLLVGGDVVAYQRQDHHHHVLGHRNGVAESNLRHGDVPAARGLQIHVVAADTRCEAHAQLRSLGDALCRHVRRPERLRDHHLRTGQVLLELRIGAVFIGCHDKLNSTRLQKGPQAQLAADTAEQRTGREIRLRCRGRRTLAVGVAFDLGNRIPSILRRVACDWVIVEHTDDLAARRLLRGRNHLRRRAKRGCAKTRGRPLGSTWGE